MTDRQMKPQLSHRLRRNGAIVLVCLGVFCLLGSLYGYGRATIGSICVDGFRSSSSGQGTCSSHGGVASEVEVNTLFGRQPGEWIWLTQWPLFGAGVGLLGLGTVGAMRSRRAEKADAATGQYLEFAVALETTANGWRVEASAPTGRSARQLRNAALPLDRGLEELNRLLAEPTTRRVGSKRAKAIENFGTQLFELLFDGPIEQLYRDSIDYVRERQCALRIGLQLDESVSDIPWEYLYDPDRGSFLALSSETSVVRMAKTVHATRPMVPIDMVRLLVMGANPHGTDDLDLDAEHDRIRSALEDKSLKRSVKLRFVTGGSLSALREALDEFEPHVFHFTGHGRWDEDLDDGVVLFEARGGRQQPVTGRDLGVLLNRNAMRLVMFNSCDGGRASKVDRFAGVASSLVAQGVPAAVGMQFRFDDQAAAVFGSTMLRDLAEGTSVDESLTTARQAVFSIPNDTEWATPVLTSRVDVDQILPRP